MKKAVIEKKLGKIVIEVTCECGCKDKVTVTNSFRRQIEKQTS